jgi:cell wall-associated NlpC family hydrolase
MQSQCLRNVITVPSRPVAAAALCAAVLCTPRAQAQVSAGSVEIDVAKVARPSAAARTVLAAIGATRTASASRVLSTAERYLGVPYRWGGTSPRTGFDCSGFVQYVFAKHGTRLPRTSREMASSGRRLRPQWSALAPGDLVLFAEPGERISHVAIYAGSRRIIHASSSGRRVRYDALDTKRGRWFSRRIVAARRVSPRGAALVSDLLGQ